MMFVPKLGTEQLGVSLEAGSSLMAALGITNFLARFVVGFLCQKNMVSPVTIQLWGRIGCSLCAISYNFIHDYWLMTLVVGVQGLAKAFYICAEPLSVLKLFGVARVNFGMGMVLFSAAVGSFSFSPVVSYFYQMSESKLFGGLAAISVTYGIAAVFNLVVLIIDKYQTEPGELDGPKTMYGTIRR